MRVIGLRGLALAGLVGAWQRAELAQGGHVVVDRPAFGCLAVAEGQDVDHGYGDGQAEPSRSQERPSCPTTRRASPPRRPAGRGSRAKAIVGDRKVYDPDVLDGEGYLRAELTAIALSVVELSAVGVKPLRETFIPRPAHTYRPAVAVYCLTIVRTAHCWMPARTMPARQCPAVPRTCSSARGLHPTRTVCYRTVIRSMAVLGRRR